MYDNEGFGGKNKGRSDRSPDCVKQMLFLSSIYDTLYLTNIVLYEELLIDRDH